MYFRIINTFWQIHIFDVFTQEMFFFLQALYLEQQLNLHAKVFISNLK